MQRGYVNIGSQTDPIHLHFRMMGQGPALVFLHASPMSSVAMLPLMEAVSSQVTAIALDTPGYGYSDQLPEDVQDLSPYVRALDKFRQGLNLDSMGLYGSATGAQIAIEYAKDCQAHCDFVILDNAADFSDQERDEITNGYFPDLTVESTGGHLARTWGLALDQLRFFPWHHQNAACRLPSFPIDPDMVQSMVTQFLQAGGDYDQAYRAAFNNEKAERLAKVQVPTTVLRWQGSILKKYTDKFDDHEWPNNFVMQQVPADQRVQGLSEAVARHVEGQPGVNVRVPDDKSCAGPRFANLSCGSVHEVCSGGEGTPWILLHDLGGSSCAIKPVVAAFAENHGLLAPDLPGHGASDLRLDKDLDFITGTSGVVQGLVSDYRMNKVNVLAFGESAALAIELARQTADLVQRVVLLNPMQGAEFLNAEPSLDGTHLIRLWHQVKNQAFYLSSDDMTAKGALAGEPDVDPTVLNQRVLDLLRSRPAYSHAKASSDAYDIVSLAKQVSSPVVIARTSATTAGERSRRSFPTLNNSKLVELPNSPDGWPNLLIDSA